ncbi:MAG: type II secretion system protein [Candidatus Pacebacteria bacterium]|nr:type II secretion system protein [Candidatus Paceibacterota bacterium]MDD5356694.1 type II secretion system protein [Candidatus Paceibacterota bacterium]
MKLPKIFIHKEKTCGFTLIEILVVMAIFTLLSGLGLFMTFDSYRGASSRSERDTVVSLLERARSQAMNNVCFGASCVGGKRHGISIQSNQYVIFEGGNYASRDSEVDQITPANPTAIITPIDVVFDQLTGKLYPQLSPATTELIITIKQADRPDSIISINNEGTINW